MRGQAEAEDVAEVATALLDAGVAKRVSRALVEGDLTVASTAVRHAALADGSRVVEARLGDLQRLWRRRPDLSGEAIALILDSVVAGVGAERRGAARIEVVWTGPRAETSYLRATRQVVIELIRGAGDEVLLVGYWIASGSDPTGSVVRIVETLGVAARRGVRVRVVLDHGLRPDGGSNRDLFLGLWPKDLPPPAVFTWRTEGDDPHLKLHAKVTVADRRDALITSANLTMHAMDANMEMGVRVIGAAAASIAEHFDVLMADGTLQLYGRDP